MLISIRESWIAKKRYDELKADNPFKSGRYIFLNSEDLSMPDKNAVESVKEFYLENNNILRIKKQVSWVQLVWHYNAIEAISYTTIETARPNGVYASFEFNFHNGIFYDTVKNLVILNEIRNFQTKEDLIEKAKEIEEAIEKCK